MTRRHVRALLDTLLLALIGATVVVVAAPVQPVRPFVVLAAASLVPGGALLTRLRTGEGMVDVALAIGLSLAIAIGGSAVLAWTNWWHPEVLAGVLGAASASLLVGDLLHAWRR